MKRILFIDRDGVLLEEPADDEQIDALEKVRFVPKMISALGRIARETDYLLIMVSNQDGLGTETFTEAQFEPPQQLLLQTLAGEGVIFDAVHIDRSLPDEQLPTRKPGTAMLQKYIDGEYDLENSFVIGDQKTDLELAANLGTRAIWFADEPATITEAAYDLATRDWDAVSRYLTGGNYPLPDRRALLRRSTSETEISLELNLDGTGAADISTGLHFFDHMLEQVARHSRCDIALKVVGDLAVDEHHTIEDTALVLGQAFLQALGDKRGISRYGFMLPMDETLARAAIDFSGRPWLVWNVSFSRERIGDVPTEMFFHFFKSFSDEARCNLHLSAEGENSHHIAEGLFKAFARAIRGAVRRDAAHMVLPTTKGVL